MIRFVSIVAFLGIGTAVLSGEGWRSELYPEDWAPPHERSGLCFVEDKFIQDFSYAGYRRGEVPLPEKSEPVLNAAEEYGADPTGETDSTAGIQRALDAAGERGGGVVYLPEGTYRLSLPDGAREALSIRRPGVVLRGAGKDRTRLVNHTVEMRQSAVIRLRPDGDRGIGIRTVRGEPLRVARDYPGPTRDLVLEDVGDLAAGDWIAVHNPFTDEPSEEGSMVEDLLMTEEAWCSWIGAAETLYGPVFLRKIEEVDAATRTIRLDAPTRWRLLRRDGARVYRPGVFLEENGLEDFSIANLRHPGKDWGVHEYTQGGTPAHEVHSSMLIQMDHVINSWIRNVSTFDPGNDNGAHLLSNGILLRDSHRVTIEKCEFGRAQYGGAGGNGYMYRLNDSGENLIRDSRAHQSRHGFVFWGMGSMGNVIHDCLDETTHYQAGHTGESFPIGGRGSDHHGWFSASNLVDYSTGRDSFFEAVFRGRIGGPVRHGQTSSQTVFWNIAGEGSDYPFAVRTEQFGWGYAIGTRGPNAEVVTATGRAGAKEVTAPEDHVEGAGRGDTLEPRSLYLDQLRRRTAGGN